MNTMTYEIAHAAATDEANRQMRADGRRVWNQDDRNLACKVEDRLWWLSPDGSIHPRAIINCIPKGKS